MIDAVLSYHTNPHTCGVAKFNQRLARELGVPHRHMFDANACLSVRHPLVSIKPSEIAYPADAHWGKYDLFLHDDTLHESAVIVANATRVYAANRVIAEKFRGVRPDVVEAWCPSTIEGNPTRGAVSVLTFGMAHKIQTARYDKLKALLDDLPCDYTVSVSTAIHEGSPWDETALVAGRLKGIFGARLRVLGYLADDALAKELHDCTAVALFFEPALRANNTTFWAAVDAGRPIVTNLDADSPVPNGASAVWNIDTLHAWPGDWFHRQFVGGAPSYTWAGLVRALQGQPCAK